MLRKSLLYLSTADWAQHIATHQSLARRVARRFVAGEQEDEVVQAAHKMEELGILATLDYLGESVTDASDTEHVVAAYLSLLTRIHESRLRSSISLKLTHLGYDVAETLCVSNLRTILTRARQYDIPVTIDMESSAYTDATLRIYRTMRDEYDFHNVGTVIQAYLRRSADDMQALAAEGSHIRLCKGAYLEPPDIAFPDKADVDRNYIDLMRAYLTANSGSYLCIATHDEKMIQAALEIIETHQIPSDRYEFQMLYGIRSDRQQELAQAGYPIRAYIPYGEAWYPYFMRRLAERPANLWFFVRSLFG